MSEKWPDTWLDSSRRAPEIDTSVAHPARIYDYWLGGKDNFPRDREAAEKVMEVHPQVVTGVRANRAFLGRAVRYLAEEAGIRQFLDIGTGIPAANNTHEVAQEFAPDSRVVYVDNDPIVLLHARTLLKSSPQGATNYIDADLRDVGKILRGAAETLDFTKPIAITLLMILHLIEDHDDPYGLVAKLVDAVPSGSYLVISHTASDVGTELLEVMARLNERMGGTKMAPRTRAQVARFFEGLEMVDPGLVQEHRWRPGAGDFDSSRDLPGYGGMARKP